MRTPRFSSIIESVATLTHYTERYRAAVQELVRDELVLSVGVFTHAVEVAADGSRRPWVVPEPDGVALGAGSTTAVAIQFRAVGMDIEPVTVLARWQRIALEITLHEDAAARILCICERSDGARAVELRSPRQLGAFDHVNDALHRELGLVAVELSSRPGS